MSYRFEKLIVWQKAMNFCIDTYLETKKFPKEEMYGLVTQLRRASTSIALNIAEGSACKSKKEFLQFLYISLRSQYEVATILKLSNRLGYLNDENTGKLENNLSEIGRLTQAMINSFQKPKTNNQKLATALEE